MSVELTADNYYQDTSFLSTSQVKSFMECESRQMAIMDGLWEDETENKAFLIGNFIHSYFESEQAHADFMAEKGNKMISKSGKTKGQLLKDFQVAEEVCRYLEQDKAFMDLYHNGTQKELIVTGEIQGLPFKGKLDSVNIEKGYFVDLKTMASIYARKYLSEIGSEVPQALYNIFTYGYDMQFYVYRELLEQQGGFFDGYLMAVSKEENPQKKLILFDEPTYNHGKKKLTAYLGRLKQVLNGTAEPIRCESCDYCKATQKEVKAETLTDFLNDYLEKKTA